MLRWENTLGKVMLPETRGEKQGNREKEMTGQQTTSKEKGNTQIKQAGMTVSDTPF